MPAPLLLALPSLIKAAPALVDAGLKVASKLQDRDEPSGPPQGQIALSSAAPRSGLPRFDSDQRAAMAAIDAEVRAAALTPALAASRPALTLALVANAYAESRLRPNARNPNGEDSIGLFQANRQGGLGVGHSVADLKDPRFNTRVVLAETARLGAKFDQLLLAGATIPQLTAGFTLWVERPADTKARARERAEMIAGWFPQLAGVRAYRWGA